MGVSVREKPKGSGVWWVFVRHHGKRTSKRVGQERTADKVAEQIRAKLALGTFKIDDGSKDTPTYKEYSTKWLEAVLTTRRKSTHERYDQILKSRVWPTFGSKQIDTIRRSEIRDFLLKESEKGIPRATIRIIRDVMNGPFKMAVEDEILPASPMTGITKALRLEARQYKVRALDAREQILLLDTARSTDPRIYPLILFMLRTGVRLGEAIGIQWQDLDLEKGIVWIRRSFRRGTFDPPKNGKPRAVRLTKETIATLAALSAQNGAEQDHFVFPANKAGKDPMPQNSAKNRFKGVLGQAGLDSRIRIHALRHTYVTNRLSLGHPIDQVSREAGHSSIEITANIYSHWIPEKTDEAIHDLDRIGKPEAGRRKQ